MLFWVFRADGFVGVGGLCSQFVQEFIYGCDGDGTVETIFVLDQEQAFSGVTYAIGRMELTGHVRSKTILNSCPRQPEASSRLHLSKTLPSTPKQSASIRTILVSCMSYLRRISSSGKSNRKHIAVVFRGRGENRLRSSAIHLLKT
jgi:hypothetical protein